jgi:hypothetical protein
LNGKAIAQKIDGGEDDFGDDILGIVASHFYQNSGPTRMQFGLGTS